MSVEDFLYKRYYFANNFNRLSFCRSFFGRFYPHPENLAYPVPVFLTGAWVATGLTKEKDGVGSALPGSRVREVRAFRQVRPPKGQPPTAFMHRGVLAYGGKASAVRACSGIV